MTTTNRRQTAVSANEAAGIASERLRIAAIIESPEGKRNPAMANELALYSSLDAESARSILSKAPAANPYLAAMDQEGPIGVTATTTNINADAKTLRLEEIKTGIARHNEIKGYRKREREG